MSTNVNPVPAQTTNDDPHEGAPKPACCTPEEQSTCCEPTAKSACCGAPAPQLRPPSSCGCR
ncbi:MAG: hypothetical protein JST00_31340 [Deltaproteobacteria bacterium]|nr:hypothetical protein [Deltaproteobacteria bacterium]